MNNCTRKSPSWQTSVYQELDNTSPKSINSLPNELILKIFSHLINLATLETLCYVSKKWSQLTSEPDGGLWRIAIYRELAFGNDKWARCFGKDVIKDENEDLSSLPLSDFLQNCEKFKSVFPEKKWKDNLMLVRLPKTLNGGLNLNCIYGLAQRHYFDPTKQSALPKATNYCHITAPITGNLGDKSINASIWASMTTTILPDSRNKTLTDQQTIIDQLAKQAIIGYKIPTTLEATVCIFAQYFNSGMRLFSQEPETYTRCGDNFQEGFQPVVGNFDLAGLHIFSHPNYPVHSVGVAALRKF